MDSKLKCVFDVPNQNSETNGDTVDDTVIAQEKVKKTEAKPPYKVSKTLARIFDKKLMF